jgi:hypothetical protein
MATLDSEYRPPHLTSRVQVLFLFNRYRIKNRKSFLNSAEGACTPSGTVEHLLLSYYRGCWHEIGRSCTLLNVILLSKGWALRPGLYSRSRPCDIAGSGFPPLPKIPHCCRDCVGAVSQSPCGRSVAKPGKGSSAW